MRALYAAGMWKALGHVPRLEGREEKTAVKRRGESDVAEDGDAFGFGAFPLISRGGIWPMRPPSSVVSLPLCADQVPMPFTRLGSYTTMPVATAYSRSGPGNPGTVRSSLCSMEFVFQRMDIKRTDSR